MAWLTVTSSDCDQPGPGRKPERSARRARCRQRPVLSTLSPSGPGGFPYVIACATMMGRGAGGCGPETGTGRTGGTGGGLSAAWPLSGFSVAVGFEPADGSTALKFPACVTLGFAVGGKACWGKACWGCGLCAGGVASAICRGAAGGDAACGTIGAVAGVGCTGAGSGVAAATVVGAGRAGTTVGTDATFGAAVASAVGAGAPGAAGGVTGAAFGAACGGVAGGAGGLIEATATVRFGAAGSGEAARMRGAAWRIAVN